MRSPSYRQWLFMTGNTLGQFTTLCSSDVLGIEVLIWLLCHPVVTMGRLAEVPCHQRCGPQPERGAASTLIFSSPCHPHLLSLPALPLQWPLHSQHATFPDLIRWLNAPMMSQKDPSSGLLASDSSHKTALCLPR